MNLKQLPGGLSGTAPAGVAEEAADEVTLEAVGNEAK